jgi:hypothetical protein
MDSPIIRQAKLRALNDMGIFRREAVESPSVKKSRAPKKARKAPYKTAALMKEVLNNPDDFDPTTRRQAQFMKNILKKDY